MSVDHKNTAVTLLPVLGCDGHSSNHPGLQNLVPDKHLALIDRQMPNQLSSFVKDKDQRRWSVKAVVVGPGGHIVQEFLSEQGMHA